MASLRFPFSFPQRPGRPNNSFPVLPAAIAAAVAATVGVGTAVAASTGLKAEGSSRRKTFSKPHDHAPCWASLSLADSSTETSLEPTTRTAFPNVIDGTKRLLGVGLRKKSVLGLKNVDVYAFGIYADDNDIKDLKQKYGGLPLSELAESKELYSDVLEENIHMTVRLQIVYGRLSIRSVRNAFEQSIGSRLQKFSQLDNKELLHRFTSLFRDEYKIPRGAVIELMRDDAHVLHTKIDGKEIGCIQSQLLCKSILDLYVGDDPLDKKAKRDFELGLASLLQN